MAGEETTSWTTIAPVEGKNRKSTLAVRKKGSLQAGFGTSMGITKVGASASGKNYSAKKKLGAASASVSRK
jgi:hypothetical protein